MTTRRNLFGLLAGAAVAPYIPAASVTAAHAAMTYDWKPYSVGFNLTQNYIAVNQRVYRAFVAELYRSNALISRLRRQA